MIEIVEKPALSPLTIVTGGAGFLGSHLCDRLIAEGHEVLCMDDLLTGRIENIQHLWDHPRFLFVLHDVTNPICLEDLAGSGEVGGARGTFPAKSGLHPSFRPDISRNQIRRRRQSVLGRPSRAGKRDSPATAGGTSARHEFTFRRAPRSTTAIRCRAADLPD